MKNSKVKEIKHSYTPSDPNASGIMANSPTRHEIRIHKSLICAGLLLLACVYSHSLVAQQAAKQRISVSQAVNFPNDI